MKISDSKSATIRRESARFKSKSGMAPNMLQKAVKTKVKKTENDFIFLLRVKEK
jgi:hypothetical protein